MIQPIRNHEGKVRRLPITASATLTKWNFVKMTSGYLAVGAAADDEVEYVALETITDTTAVDGSTYCDVLPIDETIEFEVLANATPVQATHVGNDYDVASAATIDLGNTTDKVFHIDEIINATDKLVRGHFNKPALA